MPEIMINVTVQGSVDHTVWLNFPDGDLFGKERQRHVMAILRDMTAAAQIEHERMLGDLMPCECGCRPWRRTLSPMVQHDPQAQG